MRFATGDGDPAKRRPSAVLALSFSLLSQLSNPSHHTRHNTFTIPMDPKGDDDRAQDLCMGTKRKYDWKLEAGMGVYGVNCDGDSEVEGDVFWTMPPKYELSY